MIPPAFHDTIFARGIRADEETEVLIVPDRRCVTVPAVGLRAPTCRSAAIRSWVDRLGWTTACAALLVYVNGIVLELVTEAHVVHALERLEVAS